MKVFYDDSCKFCTARVKSYTCDLVKLSEKKQLKQVPKKYLLLDSIIVEENGNYYVKSDAALRLLCQRSKLFVLFYIVPRFIRDLVYDVIAKIRHKL